MKCINCFFKKLVVILQKNERNKSFVLNNHSDWSTFKEISPLKTEAAAAKIVDTLFWFFAFFEENEYIQYTYMQCYRYTINSKKFNEYALDTSKRLREKYSWYYLSPSVYKVLNELQLLTSKNKDINKFRLHHARKTSRVASYTDLLNRLLLSSVAVFVQLDQIWSEKIWNF